MFFLRAHSTDAHTNLKRPRRKYRYAAREPPRNPQKSIRKTRVCEPPSAATRDSRTAPSLSHRRQRIMSPIHNINIYSVNTRAAARARNPERTLHARRTIAHAPLRLTHSRHAAALRPRLSPIAGKRSCAGRPFAFFGARAGLPAAAAAAAVGMAPMRAEGSPP